MSILIDSGVFYAFYNRRDVHHLDSICLLFHVLEGRYGRPYTLDLVVSEVYTLLRYRVGVDASLAFLDVLERSGIEIFFFDNSCLKGVKDVLKEYSERKLSFTDAFIIYIVEKYGIKFLASYDKRSFSGIIETIGLDYAKSLPKKELKRIFNMVKSNRF